MSFINKNVNMFLFLLIILTVTVMIGGTVFYGGRFTNITVDYNEMVQRTGDLNQKLVKCEAQSNYSQAVITKTQVEKDNLKKVYTTQTGKLEGEVQTCNSTLATAQSELGTVKSKLEDTEKELEKTKDKLETVQAQLDSKIKDYLCFKQLLTANGISYSSCD